jgi:hypothetical protein
MKATPQAKAAERKAAVTRLAATERDDGQNFARFSALARAAFALPAVAAPIRATRRRRVKTR